MGDSQKQPNFPYTHLWVSAGVWCHNLFRWNVVSIVLVVADGETHIREAKMHDFEMKKYAGELSHDYFNKRTADKARCLL